MDNQNFMEQQEMPLNLSVKDNNNRKSFLQSPSHGAEDRESLKIESHNLEADECNSDRSSLDKPLNVMQRKEPQELTPIDSCDEQKQTAAVALCQLAAYSPNKLQTGNTEKSNQEANSQCTDSAPEPSDAPENHGSQKTKGQKRTSQREAAKGQQGTKRARTNECSRVFTLRKRTRVS